MTLRTWDGSISMTSAADGGPAILYDAQDGKAGSDPHTLRDSAILGVARLVDPANDAYLMTWARAANNPVNFTGAPIAFPGQVWRNGDHFNFVGQGNLFQTTDPSFHSWTNMGKFTGVSEHSGDWASPVPNQIGGAPSAAGLAKPRRQCAWRRGLPARHLRPGRGDLRAVAAAERDARPRLPPRGRTR